MREDPAYLIKLTFFILCVSATILRDSWRNTHLKILEHIYCENSFYKTKKVLHNPSSYHQSILTS